MKNSPTNEDKFKIVLVNVQKQIDLETIELIFENSKYMGKCDDDYIIKAVEEVSSSDSAKFRDVIIKYSSEKCKYSRIWFSYVRIKLN